MVTPEAPDVITLVGAARHGDRDAFAALVARYERPLRSYLHRMSGSPDDAADIYQDTVLKAFEQLPHFRGEASFKTWLFRIASSTAIDWLRGRSRWAEDAQDTAKAAAIADPGFRSALRALTAASEQTRFEVKEHVSHCFTCVARTLPPEQQLALLLRDVYDFTNAAGATVLDKTEAAFKHLVHEARGTMTAVFERRCALVGKGGACWQCRELSELLRGPDETARQLADLDPRGPRTLADRLEIVREVDPLHAAGTDLHAFLLHQLRAANKYG